MMNGEEAKWLNSEEDPIIDRGPFADPVVRCDSCNKIIRGDLLRKLGACSNCGNKRVRNVTIFNEEERDQMVAWGFESFVVEFEVVVDE